MSTRSQQRLSISSLVMLLFAFIAAVIVANQLFKGLRIDLTENRLYTLSDGTKRLLGNIDETINLYFYFSDQASTSIPSLRDYATRVREMLEEFAGASNGKIRLNVIDPLPFSEEEDRAAQFGLQGVQLSATPDSVFMGLAGTNSVDDEEIISFFQPEKEAFLEYDIAKLVSALSTREKTIIGLLSGVSMSGQFDPQTQRMQPPWVVYQQAQQLFEIRDLGTSFDNIDDDVSVLWIVQPKNLSDSTQYAIDQFVMRGGKALIFVDPTASIDATQMEGMPQGLPPMGQSSDLPQLFAGWSLTYSATDVIADARLALEINTGSGRGPTRHLGYLGVGKEQTSQQDITTAELNVINLAIAGHIGLRDDSEITIEPLLSSSSNAATMAASRFAFMSDPAVLLQGFVPDGVEYVIAARISGMLRSAFPDGRPATADSSDEAVPDTPPGDHLGKSNESANLIVVADVDMLSDPMWVQTQSFFGQQIANAFASNGAFVINALENLAGSSDLIAVRSRASFTRPFTRVEQIRVDAEARYRETEQQLQDELAETERRLGELQSSREDTGNVLLTEEQQGEIDSFIEQRSQIRKDLRAVQRGLDEDIEKLGARLRMINIGLVPLLLTLFVLFSFWRKNRSEQT